VALVKSAPAGAVVGLFGLTLEAVRSELLQAAALMSASPIAPQSQYLFMRSSLLRGGG
jgi:hypothetical protein